MFRVAGAPGVSSPTITGITIAGSTTAANFQAATANANVGVVNVTTSDSSNATVSLPSGFNPNGFALTGAISGVSLLAPAGGLAVSPPTYPLRIQASGPYSNSPQFIDVTLTAVAAGALQVLINGSSSPAAVISGDSIWVGVRNIPAGLGLNVFVTLVDHTQTLQIQQITIPNPAPPNPDLVFALTELNPILGGQRPISTPGTYYVIIQYQGSATIQASSPGFTINAYQPPPFTYIAANTQVGALPIIYIGISTTPSGNTLFKDNPLGGGGVTVVKGTSVTVSIGSYRSSSGGVSPANVWAQFLVFGPGIPAAGKNLGAPVFVASGFPSVTFDSTDATLFPSGDGTYMVMVRLVDIADGANYAYGFIPTPVTMIIQNVGAKPVVGTYTIPTASINGNAHVLSPGIDYVTYNGVSGTPIQSADFPYPGPGRSVVNTLPVWNTASIYNPATGGNPADARTAAFYGEAIHNLPSSEYTQFPRFMTTPVGGIAMVPWSSEGEGDQSVEGAYPPTANQNFYDGGRMSNTVSGNTNMIATPETGPFSAYHWTFVSLDGRVAVMDLTGKVLTIAGPRADTSKVPLDWQYSPNPEFPNTVFVGTISATPGLTFSDMGSANDVCWDPRNSSICYVAKPVDHIVVKCDFTVSGSFGPSNPLLTIYAGQNGVGGYVDGAAISHALLNGPYSICMVKNTVNATYPKGTMFIADNYNGLIRVVSADGSTVSTLTGFGGGETTIPPSNFNTFETLVLSTQTVTVTSITQNGDGTTAAVVLGGTAPAWPYAVQAVGWKLKIYVGGSPYTGGGGSSAENPYGIYTVTAFTNSQHFSVLMHPVPSGTITAILSASDAFSSPNAVPFATAYTAIPFVIRMTSGGDIVLGEAWYNIMARRIWLSGVNVGKITRLGSTGDLADNQNNPGWGWLEVDDGVGADGVVHAQGACGPVDDIVQFKFDSNPGSASFAWRRSLDGTYSGNWPGQKSANFPAEGPYGVGHYPWGFCFSKSQLRMFSVGKGLTGFASWRQLLSGDPNWNTIDPVAWPNNGTFAPDGWAMGTVPPFPFGMRPSLAALYGQTGAHLFGANVLPTLDQVQVTYPNDYSGSAGTVLATFIQNGAGGQISRPEFAVNGSGVPGRPLAYLIYMMRRQSLPGSYPTQRAPLYINTNSAGCGMLATAGSVSLNYVRPTITVGPTATRVSGTPKTSINVTWTTNVPTLSTVAGGSPNSYTAGVYPYSVWATPESSFGTTHNVTISGLPDASLSGMAPTHIAVLGIDQDGNPYWSADIAVPYP